MSSARSRGLIGNTLALTSAIAFAVSNASASVAFYGGSNPPTLAATRFILPTVVLVVWLRFRGNSLWLSSRDGWIAVGLGAITAAYSWALLGAIGTIPLSLAILIFYLFPLVAAVIVGVRGWETISWTTIASIFVALIGLALALDLRVGNHDTLGIALAFSASIGLGTVVAVSGQVLRTGNSRRVTLYMAGVSATLLIALCALRGDFALPATATGWLGFSGAAILYAFAIIAFFMAVSIIGPMRTSLLCYAEPVASAGLGVMALGEVLTLVQVVGIALVVGSLVGATLWQQRAK